MRGKQCFAYSSTLNVKRTEYEYLRVCIYYIHACIQFLHLLSVISKQSWKANVSAEARLGSGQNPDSLSFTKIIWFLAAIYMTRLVTSWAPDVRIGITKSLQETDLVYYKTKFCSVYVCWRPPLIFWLIKLISMKSNYWSTILLSPLFWYNFFFVYPFVLLLNDMSNSPVCFLSVSIVSSFFTTYPSLVFLFFLFFPFSVGLWISLCHRYFPVLPPGGWRGSLHEESLLQASSPLLHCSRHWDPLFQRSLSAHPRGMGDLVKIWDLACVLLVAHCSD